MRVSLALGLLALAAWAWPARVQQRSSCELVIRQTPGMRTHYVTLGDGTTRIDAGGGVEATCGDRWLRADSATWFRGRGTLYLYEDVRYRDGARTLTSERATYFEAEERVRAEGDVRLTDTERGSTLSGPVLDYFPRTENRPVERMFAPRRPHLSFYPEDAAADARPFEVDADRVHIYGDSLVAGAGRAVAVRDDLQAFGDSMDLNLASGQLWLLGDPRVESGEMTLTGDSVLVRLEDQQVREIEAWPNASARGSELAIRAPLLRLFVEDQGIERTVATPGDPGRTGVVDSAGRPPWAWSESQDYRLVADSLDIRRPGSALERVIAVTRARATTLRSHVPTDTILGRDWMEGDTITGFFAPPPDVEAEPSGDAQQAQLERLEATGNARALYHLQQESADSLGRLAINYVIGKAVILWLGGGEVDSARVVGPAIGLYNEPIPLASDGDTAAIRPDSARGVADTAAVSADTSGVRRGR